MALALRARVVAGVRAYLIQDTELTTLLGQTDTINKIAIDHISYDVAWPAVALTTVTGGRINDDPFPDFDIFIRAEVLGDTLSELYPVYGRIEAVLADANLPTAFDVQYYAPVRATDSSFFEVFKIAQKDLYRIGGDFRIRGVMLNGD